MGNRDHPVRGEQGGEFLLRDALLLNALEQCWGDQDYPYARVPESLVDLADQQGAQGDIFVAEPDRRTAGLQAVAQLGRAALAVVPCVTEEQAAGRSP